VCVCVTDWSLLPSSIKHFGPPPVCHSVLQQGSKETGVKTAALLVSRRGICVPILYLLRRSHHTAISVDPFRPYRTVPESGVRKFAPSPRTVVPPQTPALRDIGPRGHLPLSAYAHLLSWLFLLKMMTFLLFDNLFSPNKYGSSSVTKLVCCVLTFG